MQWNTVSEATVSRSKIKVKFSFQASVVLAAVEKRRCAWSSKKKISGLYEKKTA